MTANVVKLSVRTRDNYTISTYLALDKHSFENRTEQFKTPVIVFALTSRQNKMSCSFLLA